MVTSMAGLAPALAQTAEDPEPPDGAQQAVEEALGASGADDPIPDPAPGENAPDREPEADPENASQPNPAFPQDPQRDPTTPPGERFDHQFEPAVWLTNPHEDMRVTRNETIQWRAVSPVQDVYDTLNRVFDEANVTNLVENEWSFNVTLRNLDDEENLTLANGPPAETPIEAVNRTAFELEVDTREYPGFTSAEVVVEARDTTYEDADRTPKNRTASGPFEINRPPSVNPIEDRSFQLGNFTTFNATATDPNGDRLDLSLAPSPPPENVDWTPQTGEFFWRPGLGQNGTHTFEVAVRGRDLERRLHQQHHGHDHGRGRNREHRHQGTSPRRRQ
jgi:hypothetical protein